MWRKSYAAERAADFLDAKPEETALDGNREDQKWFGSDEYSFRSGNEVLRLKAVEFGGPVVFFAVGPDGGRGQGFGEGRVEGGLEFGDDGEAEPVALEVRVGVGAVFPPGEAALGEPVPDIGTPQVEERPDNAGIGNGANPAESRSTGTAEEAVEDGFGLVVERVAGGDRERLRGEEGIADSAGFLFDVAFGERGRWRRNGRREFVGEMADEGFVVVGFEAAEFVVDVEDGGGAIELMEDMGERNGIGSA